MKQKKKKFSAGDTKFLGGETVGQRRGNSTPGQVVGRMSPPSRGPDHSPKQVGFLGARGHPYILTAHFPNGGGGRDWALIERQRLIKPDGGEKKKKGLAGSQPQHNGGKIFFGTKTQVCLPILKGRCGALDDVSLKLHFGRAKKPFIIIAPALNRLYFRRRVPSQAVYDFFPRRFPVAGEAD